MAASIVVGFVSLALFDVFAFPQTMGMIFLLLGLAGAVSRLAVTGPVGAASRAARPMDDLPS